MAASLTWSGYFPGLIGQLTELHGSYYNRFWGFDVSFEAQVATEFAAFAGRVRRGRDLLLAAGDDRGLAGFVALDGDAGEPGARLRWFIVRPDMQGSGLGRELLERAMAFAGENNYNRVYLYTFRGLDAARSLYERAGFRLAHEEALDTWGTHIVEQMFETRPPAD